MALKQVVVSDISGVEVPTHKAARVVVAGHPALDRTVELDLTTDEASLLKSIRLDLVNVTVHTPGASPRQVVLDASALCNTFADVDVVKILQSARHSSTSQNPGRRRGSGRPARKPKENDYSSVQFAGNVHRGKVTAAEAATVREHLDAINRRLLNEGRPIIDPNDPIAQRRYGFAPSGQ